VAKTYHVKCPNCGGLLSARDERVLKCKFCGERSLVTVPDWIPSYYLAPRLDLPAARRAMVNLFKHEAVETGMLKTARFEAAEMFFVPLYHLKARRVGTIMVKPAPVPLKQIARQGMKTFSSALFQENYSEIAAAAERMANQKPDTKIILSDVLRSIPALRLSDWGADFLDPEKAVTDAGAQYQSCNREQMDRLGTVLEPSLSTQESVNRVFNTRDFVNTDNTEIVDQRIDLVYYPVWRVRWKYQGRTFHASLDAVSGEILFARAPARQRARVGWLLLVTASVGISVGKMLGFLKLLFLTGSFAMWFMFIFTTAMISFVAFGWNMFRYSGEIIVQPDGARFEWVGRPPETVFDKMASAMGDLLAQAFRARTRGFRG